MDSLLHDEEATYRRIEQLFEKTIHDCFNRKYSGLIQPVQTLLEELQNYSGDHIIANIFAYVQKLLVPLGLNPKSHHFGWSSEVDEANYESYPSL